MRGPRLYRLLQKDVVARSFTLCDENGRERAKLSIVNGDPLLWFADAKGRLKMTVGLARGGDPQIILADEKGVGRVGLDLSEDGPSVFLRDSKGDIRLGLDFDEKHGLSVLTFCGDDGSTLLQMRVDTQDQFSDLSFFDSSKASRIRVKSGVDDQSVSIMDGEGKVLALLSDGGIILTSQDGVTRTINAKSRP